jgi:hypothetical protein
MHSIREDISPEYNTSRKVALKDHSSYVDLPRIVDKKRSKGSFSGNKFNHA